MMLTAFILAAGLSGQPPATPAEIDPEHRFLRTFWGEYLGKDNDTAVYERKTREIDPQPSQGPAPQPQIAPPTLRIPD